MYYTIKETREALKKGEVTSEKLVRDAVDTFNKDKSAPIPLNAFIELYEDAVEKARKVIARAREVENFGNGRYIDQFVQKIVINHAIRLQNEEDLDKLRRLTKDDIIYLKAETSRNRIGFNMN